MPHSSGQVLELKHLRVQYPSTNKWILNGLDLTLSQGESVALVGPSGCGKSTVAKASLKLLPAQSICEGEIFLGGKDPRQLKEVKLRELRAKTAGLIFQDPMTRLNPLIKIEDHLLDTLQAHQPQTSYKKRKQKAEILLEKVGINPSRINAYPHELSGGMRQRLGIALAIALNPPLIIADEPTTSLDVAVADQIMHQLTNLCKEMGVALLLISHDLALAAKWCKRLAILDKGRIVEDGPCKKILSQPESQVGRIMIESARKKEIFIPESKELKSTVLEINNLRCWHKQGGQPWSPSWNKAVNGISFSLQAGETIGVVGKSGCGKSTLCRALLGLTPIRGGLVTLDNCDFLKLKGKSFQKKRKLIQMVFQDPLACLNPSMTVEDAIADPLLIHKICQKSQAKEKAMQLLQQVGLNPPEYFKNRMPKELSGGQQQRVAIARAIALMPKVLICDESVSMLDPEIQNEVLQLLKRLQKKLNIGILFITHDLQIAANFCQKIIVLDQGEIVEQGSPDTVLKEPKAHITKLLVQSLPRLS